MAKCGKPVALTLMGVRYKVPSDCEPTYSKGGVSNSESQDYGDGTSDPVQEMKAAGIEGLKIVVDEENRENFNKAIESTSMSVVLECVSKTYECTGFIVGDVSISASKRTTNDFNIKVSDGGGVRES